MQGRAFWKGFIALVFGLRAALAIAETPPAAPEAASALLGHGGPVRALVVRPDGSAVSGGFDGRIIRWDALRGRAAQVWMPDVAEINALASGPDGALVAAGGDGRIVVYRTATDRPAYFVGHVGQVAAIAVDPGRRLLASGGWDRQVRAWHLGDHGGRIVAEHKAPVTSVAFAADGRQLLSASFDGEVRLTVIDREAPAHVAKQPAAVGAAVATPDGHFLLALADGTLRELDGELRVLRTIDLQEGPLNTVAVSPGPGATIAVGGMRTPVTLIDRASGEVRSRILGPGLPLWALAFTADGRSLFTGGADRAVRQFDVASGRPIGPAIAADEHNDPGNDASAPRVFRACRACHGLTAGDTNRAGPTLYGIMGRRIATLPGYAYSPSLTAMDIVWSRETIARLFEIGPEAYTPGSRMPQQRITDPAERQALVDWLAKVTAPTP